MKQLTLQQQSQLLKTKACPYCDTELVLNNNYLHGVHFIYHLCPKCSLLYTAYRGDPTSISIQEARVMKKFQLNVFQQAQLIDTHMCPYCNKSLHKGYGYNSTIHTIFHVCYTCGTTFSLYVGSNDVLVVGLNETT